MEQKQEREELEMYECRRCGKLSEVKYYKHRCGDLCHACLFWMEKCHPSMRDSPMTVRVDGTHYRIGPENQSRLAFRGFGGREFIIQFDDGRKVITTNLWCQGSIPEDFKDALPNNAIFLKE